MAEVLKAWHTKQQVTVQFSFTCQLEGWRREVEGGSESEGRGGGSSEEEVSL
jgi:hypothetical protein